MHKKCTLLSMYHPLLQVPIKQKMSYGLRKGLAEKGDINRAILRMREVGILRCFLHNFYVK